MFDQGTRTRPRPRTVQQWKEARRDRYRSAGDKGGFRLLPIKVLDSGAFNELSKSAKIVLILSLIQLVVGKMYTTSWKKARERAELPQVRVHDLKHTFGRKLRSPRVSFEDRQDLLGHKSERITTHYSAPELINLIKASESVCRNDWHKSGTIVILKKKTARLAIAN